jgi:hypothetical protein
VTRDFDTEIKQGEMEAEAQRPMMAAALDSWLDATAPWAADYWQAAARKIALANNETLNALGADGAKSLKAEIDQLIARARPYLTRRMVEERESDWPHLLTRMSVERQSKLQRGPSLAGETFRSNGDSGPNRVSLPLGEVLASALAEIFAPHGFRLMAGFCVTAQTPHGTRYEPEALSPWTTPMLEAMASYAQHYETCNAAYDRCDELVAEREQTTAAGLWDQP